MKNIFVLITLVAAISPSAIFASEENKAVTTPASSLVHGVFAHCDCEDEGCTTCKPEQNN